MMKLFRSRRGAAAVEFALLGPIFLLMVFGIIETSRLLWAKETIKEVAYATARCMSVSDQCATEEQQRQFARSRASRYGIVIASGNIVVRKGANCNGVTANQITVSTAFNSPVRGLVPGIPHQLQASACFPVLS